MTYREQLWEEIARNDPPTAAFLKKLRVCFNSKLMTFRWKKDPRVVMCVYHRSA